MDIKEQIGGLESKIDGVRTQIDTLSEKLEENHRSHTAKIEKLDQIVQIGNGEPALKVSVKALMKAEEDRLAREARAAEETKADEKERRKTNWGFVSQIFLIIVQVVLAVLMERTLSVMTSFNNTKGQAHTTEISPTPTPSVAKMN